MKTLVSIVKTYPDSIKKATKESIDLVGGLSDLKDRRNVSIKPSLCRPSSSESGCTTDLEVVEAVIESIKAVSNCHIQVVETNNFIASADETFRMLGYKDLEKQYSNVKCVNLSKDVRLRINLNGKIFRTLQVPESLIFSDYMVNVAKLKTHVDYRYTGVLKNAYGLIPSREHRPRYHGFMHEALTDLNTVYRPDLAIVDGAIAMEGFGPVSGKPKRVGVVITSKDPVAADYVAAKIVGFKPSKIKYLRYAAENGLGNIKDIEIVGCGIEEVKTKCETIPLKWYLLGKMSLDLQRLSGRLTSFAKLLSLGRSAMSTIGYSELRTRLSIREIIGLMRETTSKIDD